MKDSRFPLTQRLAKCGSIIRGWRNYNRYCDMSGHSLWSLNHQTWKFIRKQGSYDFPRNRQGNFSCFPISSVESQ
jgi:hypothetical protein